MSSETQTGKLHREAERTKQELEEREEVRMEKDSEEGKESGTNTLDLKKTEVKTRWNLTGTMQCLISDRVKESEQIAERSHLKKELHKEGVKPSLTREARMRRRWKLIRKSRNPGVKSNKERVS